MVRKELEGEQASVLNLRRRHDNTLATLEGSLASQRGLEAEVSRLRRTLTNAASCGGGGPRSRRGLAGQAVLAPKNAGQLVASAQPGEAGNLARVADRHVLALRPSSTGGGGGGGSGGGGYGESSDEKAWRLQLEAEEAASGGRQPRRPPLAPGAVWRSDGGRSDGGWHEHSGLPPAQHPPLSSVVRGPPPKPAQLRVA